jgi:hypothetical protein
MSIISAIGSLISSRRARDRTPDQQPVFLRRQADGSFRTLDGRTATRSERHPRAMWIDVELPITEGPT